MIARHTAVESQAEENQGYSEAPQSEEKEIILKFIAESTKGMIRGPLN